MRCFQVVLVSTLVATTALAQAVQVEVGDDADMSIRAPGMKVKVKSRAKSSGARPAEQSGTAQPPPRVVGTDAFNVRFEQMGDQKVRVLGPEGARVDAWSDDGEFVGSFTAPCSFQGRAGQFYRVIVSGPDQEVLLDRKVEVKSYYRTIVEVRASATPQVPAHPAPPPHGHAPRVAMADFSAVLAAVREESFASGKLDVLRMSAGAFTVDQLGQLVDELDHSSDKVKAVEVLRERLVDPRNAFKLLSHFTFESDKKKVKALFDGAGDQGHGEE